MLRFATTNAGKVREARAYFAGVDDVEQFDYDYVEIQSDDLETIAAQGAREAFEASDGDAPVIVDDSGLFVRGLGGFPGPYSSYVDDTIGIERVWRLASDLDDRTAEFRCAVGYADAERAKQGSAGHRSGESRVGVETFTGTVEGRIVAPRGDGGFGYDPIFEYDGATFAEMGSAEKNELSHRGRALAAVADWLADR